MEPLKSPSLSGEIAGTDRISIQRVTRDGKQATEDIVAREMPLTIIFNNQELVTLLCSPGDLNSLAAGFLYSEGLLEKREDIKRVLVDEDKGIVRVETVQDTDMPAELLFKRMITSGCGRGASFYSAADVKNRHQVESQATVSASRVLSLVQEFQHLSPLYRATGGVHSAALYGAGGILAFNEDIGRHNAVDKIFGECLLKGIITEGQLMVISGRISSEILLKVAKRNVPIIVSVSAPTDLAVRLAGELGITLLGFVRGKHANIYTNEWRITSDAK